MLVSSRQSKYESSLLLQLLVIFSRCSIRSGWSLVFRQWEVEARSREGEGSTTVLNFWLGLGKGGISEREWDLEPVGLLGRGDCCEEGGGWGNGGKGCLADSEGD